MGTAEGDQATIDRQAYLLTDIDKPDAVRGAVREIIDASFPGQDFSFFETTHRDVIRLFRGQFPGYRRCLTRYHDLRHTMLVLLATARLMDGVIIEGQPISREGFLMGLVSALGHDTGYIQADDEPLGTGAQYTLIHVGRSVEFLNKYLDGTWEGSVKAFGDIMQCTGLNTRISDIRFGSSEIEAVGKILGTADLMGQMADRLYLEKLIFLYQEFKEGGVPGFESEWDLLQKTLAFYEETKRRFVVELGDMRRFMRFHFKKRHGIDRDVYSERIERHMTYLARCLKEHGHDYRRYLRRAYVPDIPG